jgi:hypothetical protein
MVKNHDQGKRLVRVRAKRKAKSQGKGLARV